MTVRDAVKNPRIAFAMLAVGTVTLLGAAHLAGQAPAAQSASSAQKTVWYFYRVKWGFQDEFQTLFARITCRSSARR